MTHPEEYFKEVEDLMESPLPTVGWYWPYVPILEVSIFFLAVNGSLFLGLHNYRECDGLKYAYICFA